MALSATGATGITGVSLTPCRLSIYFPWKDCHLETFIATATLIACFVDAARIPIYLISYHEQVQAQGQILTVVTAMAFLGTFTGKELLKKVSLESFKKFVAGMVVLLGAFRPRARPNSACSDIWHPPLHTEVLGEGYQRDDQLPTQNCREPENGLVLTKKGIYVFKRAVEPGR